MSNESRVVIRGEDKASEAFKAVERSAKSTFKAVERSAKSMGTMIFEVSTTVSSLVHITETAGRMLGTLAKTMAEPVKQALEAERAQTLLAAKVRATGAAAGYSVGELNAMATSLAGLTSFQDDAISSAQGLLLQFQGVTRSGGVFEKAIELSADLAAALGTDLEDAVMKVGKALNEPGEALNALSRAGIMFTKAEKEMIQSLAEANDVAGAQTAILAKLEQTVGGTAEALRGNFGGALTGVQNSWDNLLESVGKFITENDKIALLLNTVAAQLQGWADEVENLTGNMDAQTAAAEAMRSVMVGTLSVIQGLLRGFEFLAHVAGDLVAVFNFFRGSTEDLNAEQVELTERQTELSAEYTKQGEILKQLIKSQGANSEATRAQLAVVTNLAAAINDYELKIERAGDSTWSMTNASRAGRDAIEEMKEALLALDLKAPVEDTQSLGTATNQTARSLNLMKKAAEGLGKLKAFLKMADEARRVGDAWNEAGGEMQKAFTPSGAGPVQMIQDSSAGMQEFGEFAWNGQEAMEATVETSEALVDSVAEAGELAAALAESAKEQAEADRERQEEWDRSVQDMSDNVADSFSDAFSRAFAGMSTLEDGLLSFTQTLRQQMASAFLDPILGAQGPIARLFDPVFNVLKSIGSAIATNFIQPLITGFLRYIGIKIGGEAAASESGAALQIAAMGEVALAQKGIMALMGPPLGAMASAALVASFGSAATAALALPEIMAAGAATGTAAVAFAEGGRVTRPTFALIGEAGNETVIPESRPRRARELLEDMFSRNPNLAPGARGSRSARPIIFNSTINIQGTPDDPEALAEQIYDAINKKLGRDLRGR